MSRRPPDVWPAASPRSATARRRLSATPLVFCNILFPVVCEIFVPTQTQRPRRRLRLATKNLRPQIFSGAVGLR